MSMIRDEIPPTLSQRGGVSSDVLVGNFEGFGDPYWDTADGNRPSSEEVGSGHARILTPVVLSIDRELKGRSESASTATISGGQIGCDVFLVSGNPVLDADARYVLFLTEVLTERDATVPRLIAAWPVDANDIVDTPLDGELTLDELDNALDNPPSSPETEAPAEPPDGFPEGQDSGPSPDVSRSNPPSAP
jgi:hypothetical protein